MADILPQGENLRRAVKWISDERGVPSAERSLAKLIEEASLKFDLSPLESEWLVRTFLAKKTE